MIHMKFAMRKLAENDAKDICDWIKSRRDLLIWGGPYFDFPLKVTDLASLIAEHEGPNPTRECWAVLDERGEFAASFQLSYNYRNGQVVLGRVILKPSLRGKGHSEALLRLACEQAFSHEEMNRIELRVYPFNAPAISAYRKVGFIHEGTTRQSARLGSEYWDTMIMGLLRTELQR
jgi:RimJ/RimL family protein N-acetyltransferase